jgi:hypothetical protein
VRIDHEELLVQQGEGGKMMIVLAEERIVHN